MTKGPKGVAQGSTIGYVYDRLMPIPYRSIVRTSSSGHAAGRMSRATFPRVYRWWNASSRSCATY